MKIMPQEISAFAYPGIAAMYKKRDYHIDGNAEDVLIIETNFGDKGYEDRTFDSYMTDLLLDLESIKDQAEERVGHIDRIDIKAY